MQDGGKEREKRLDLQVFHLIPPGLAREPFGNCGPGEGRWMVDGVLVFVFVFAWMSGDRRAAMVGGVGDFSKGGEGATTSGLGDFVGGSVPFDGLSCAN